MKLESVCWSEKCRETALTNSLISRNEDKTVPTLSMQIKSLILIKDVNVPNVWNYLNTKLDLLQLVSTLGDHITEMINFRKEKGLKTLKNDLITDGHNQEDDAPFTITQDTAMSYTGKSKTLQIDSRKRTMNPGSGDTNNTVGAIPHVNHLYNDINYDEISRIVLTLYDTSGQFKEQHTWKHYINRQLSDCAIYIVDLSNKLTLEESRRTCLNLMDHNEKNDRLPFLILGNKADLVEWDNSPFYRRLTTSSARNNKDRTETLKLWFDPKGHYESVSYMVVDLMAVEQEFAHAFVGWALGEC